VDCKHTRIVGGVVKPAEFKFQCFGFVGANPAQSKSCGL
jgi:hypothetical protein